MINKTEQPVEVARFGTELEHIVGFSVAVKAYRGLENQAMGYKRKLEEQKGFEVEAEIDVRCIEDKERTLVIMEVKYYRSHPVPVGM